MTAAATEKKSPAEVDKALVGVELADARRDLEAMLPPAAELFPAMLAERVEFYMPLLFFAVSDMTDYGRQFWDRTLAPRERVFLCRLARVPRELASAPWADVGFKERARVLAMFTWLRDWVNSFHPPLAPYIAPVLRPDLELKP